MSQDSFATINDYQQEKPSEKLNDNKKRYKLSPKYHIMPRERQSFRDVMQQSHPLNIIFEFKKRNK
eukprot:snap_masked-scaffold_20-processed-gene-5.50-mRNA-1 protein AED:1.00 eAED:1.00 QI:0/0/0/0/1/1/2/0/65